MEFQKVLEERYACRSFDKEHKVEKEKLDELLSVIKLAPSAVNHQSPRIYVIQSSLGLETINGLCTCIRGASTVLLIAYNNNETWKNPFHEEIHSGEEDASIIATYLMLKATELGLGTCFVNYFDPLKAKETFRLPEEETIMCLIPIGYPSEDSEPNPVMHKKRKELNEMMRYL